MTSRGNLGLKTSARRVDQCNLACTRGIQTIRPGVLQRTRAIGCGSAIGTVHYSPPREGQLSIHSISTSCLLLQVSATCWRNALIDSTSFGEESDYPKLSEGR